MWFGGLDSFLAKYSILPWGGMAEPLRLFSWIVIHSFCLLHSLAWLSMLCSTETEFSIICHQLLSFVASACSQLVQSCDVLRKYTDDLCLGQWARASLPPPTSCLSARHRSRFWIPAFLALSLLTSSSQSPAETWVLFYICENWSWE